jgi:hypothetical protein
MLKVRSALHIAVVGAFALGAAGCGGTSSMTGSATSTSAIVARTAAQAMREPTEAGLRAAAITYANAFLTGTYRDVIAVLDPSCVPKNGTALSSRLALGDAELHRFQLLVEQRIGLDAAKIEIRTVDLRNYQGRAGEAQAQYGLPASVEGNDNWNSYAYSGNQWHIAGCDLKFPIGGQSTSKMAVATTTP